MWRPREPHLVRTGRGGGAGGYAKTTEWNVDGLAPWIVVYGGNGGDAGQSGVDGSSWGYFSTKPGKGGAGAALPGKNGANGTPSAWFSW